MQNFSAQDITYANYKEKTDMMIRNCKQNEIFLKNQQRRSFSRSNSREKSLNKKNKTTPNAPKSAQSNSNGKIQQQSSKKNLVKNSRHLSISTSCEKKQNQLNQQSNYNQGEVENSTSKNTAKMQQNKIQANLLGTQQTQNKIIINKVNDSQSCKNQSNLHQSNTFSNNQIQQQSNIQNAQSKQYPNFSSFFNSQSTKGNPSKNMFNNTSQFVNIQNQVGKRTISLGNELAEGVYGQNQSIFGLHQGTVQQIQNAKCSNQGSNGSVQSANWSVQGSNVSTHYGQKQNFNSDKVSILLQHLQNNDSPKKQIQQIQDKLMSYHLNNNNNKQSKIQSSSYGIQNQVNSGINMQQNINRNFIVQNDNLNNSYQNIPYTSNNQIQQIQQIQQRQRINSNDCIFNTNTSIINAQSDQFDAQPGISGSCLYQESILLQENVEQNSTISKQQKQSLSLINKKQFFQNKQMKNLSPLCNSLNKKKNFYSVHTSTSSNDPQKVILNIFEDHFTHSQYLAPQNKCVDLQGSNIQVSDIALNKFINRNDIINNDANSQQKILNQQQQNNIENFQFNSQKNYYDDCNQHTTSILDQCNFGSCNKDEEYLQTPKQNVFTNQNQNSGIQQTYHQTPITNDKQYLDQKQEDRIRSKSYTDQESLNTNILQKQNKQKFDLDQKKIFKKRRAFTISDDYYGINQNEDYSTNMGQQNTVVVKLDDLTKANQHKDFQNKINKKIQIPKIKYFDEMLEEKNQQMDFEIPPHVYNEVFQGEDYASSQATSLLRSGIQESKNDSLNQTQNIDGFMPQNGDIMACIQNTLKQNPIQGYKNILKTMEIDGKGGETEIKALKIVIRKLQYRDAVLRQQIAQMTIIQSEQYENISKINREKDDLIAQLNTLTEQTEIYEQQISHLQNEINQYQTQMIEVKNNNQLKQVQNELREQNIDQERLVQKLKIQLSQSEQANQDQKQQLNKSKKSEEELKIQLCQFEEDIQKQQYEFLEKLAEFQEENIRANQQQNMKIQLEIASFNDEKQELNIQINQLDQQIIKLNSQIVEIESEKQKLQNENNSIMQKNEQYKLQKEESNNPNDISQKSIRLLDSNTKLIEENRSLQDNIIILIKDNQQLKEGIIITQKQLLQSQESKRSVEDSQNVIRDLQKINYELVQNIKTIEYNNQELLNKCQFLEQRTKIQNQEIIKLSNQLNNNQNMKCDQPIQNSIDHLLKEIQTEKEKNLFLEQKIVEISSKNSLNQSMNSRQEPQGDVVVRIKLENDELKKELEDQQREKDCLEEVLKNYLLQRELERLKVFDDKNMQNDEEQDDELAEVFQSDSKQNTIQSSSHKINSDLNYQLLNYLSNSKQNKAIHPQDINLFKRNSNCTITNENNTNYQISITECSQLSLLDDDACAHIRVNNGNYQMQINQDLDQVQEFKSSGNEINTVSIQDDISNANYITSTNTNININNTNNTNNSNNFFKKSSASSSHFLREVDSNMQVLINNNSTNNLLNNIQHLLNTSSCSNKHCKENNNLLQLSSQSSLPQGHQQTSALSNSQNQLYQSQQQIIPTKFTYNSQKLKENENPFNLSNSSLINSVPNNLQQSLQINNNSDKVGQQIITQSKTSNQQLSNYKYQLNNNSKESKQARQLNQVLTNSNSILLNSNK